MNKAVVLAASVLGGVFAVAAVGALGSATNFDYANASEERQQAFLDRVAQGFTAGFKRSAKDSAEIERLKADAVYDTISVDIRFRDPSAEHASGAQVEAFRQSLYTQNCNVFASQKLLAAGVKMKLRIKRPSGGALANLAFDSEACAPYLKAAS